MLRYLPVHGTWARAEDAVGEQWWQMGSAFWRSMRGRGAGPVRPGDPYRWSGNINGLAGVLYRLLGKPPNDKEDWYAAGDALRWYARGLPHEWLNLFAHSHGYEPVIAACSHPTTPLRIRTLVTIGSPERNDTRELAARAKPNIGFHLHLYDAKFDRMGSWGAAGDGSIDWWWNPKSRALPYADLNVPVDGIGHSGLLTDESLFPLWVERGWLAMVEAGGQVAQV